MISLRKTLAAGALAVAAVALPSTAMASPVYAAPVAQGISYSVSASSIAPVISPMTDGNSAGDSNAQANKALRSTVSKDLAGNQYNLEGGGTVNGSDVISPEGEINNAILSQLSSKSQGQFAKDLVATTDKYTNPSAKDYNPSLAKSNGVDESTASNWFQELRSKSGIGSQMLTEILKKGVYADITSGAAWFKPFSNPLSTGLGFLAIAVISLLGVRSIVDISYIAIPFFQSVYTSVGIAGEGASGGSGGSGGSTRSFRVVSIHAINAVKAGEEGKNAMFFYLRKSAVEYVMVFLAILFLCFNYWWDFVGVISDSFMGIFGY